MFSTFSLQNVVSSTYITIPIFFRFCKSFAYSPSPAPPRLPLTSYIIHWWVDVTVTIKARGRLLLFEVDYAYLAKEDGRHEHAVKLRQVFAKEQLGPVAGEVRGRALNSTTLMLRIMTYN